MVDRGESQRQDRDVRVDADLRTRDLVRDHESADAGQLAGTEACLAEDVRYDRRRARRRGVDARQRRKPQVGTRGTESGRRCTGMRLVPPSTRTS